MAKDKEVHIFHTHKKEKELFLDALYKNYGNVKEASKAINYSRRTVYKWIEKDKEFEEAVEDVKSSLVDLSESKLFERIVGYSHPEDKIFVHEGTPVIVPTTKHYPPDTTAIIFHLKTQGKDRGYIERTEVETKITGAKIRIEPSDDE